jgi:hypothetical protein
MGLQGRWWLGRQPYLLPHLLAQAVRQVNTVLTPDLTLKETLALLRDAEGSPISRFVFGSPCRFVRRLDILTHIIAPELIEYTHPELARYLRSTSPRWGRSWRHW